MEIKKGKKTYEVIIDSSKLIRPISGTTRYVSKVFRIFVDDGKKKSKIEVELGESLGKTSEDAIQNMEKRVADWVEKQG